MCLVKIVKKLRDKSCDLDTVQKEVDVCLERCDKALEHMRHLQILESSTEALINQLMYKNILDLFEGTGFMVYDQANSMKRKFSLFATSKTDLLIYHNKCIKPSNSTVKVGLILYEEDNGVDGDNSGGTDNSGEVTDNLGGGADNSGGDADNSGGDADSSDNNAAEEEPSLVVCIIDGVIEFKLDKYNICQAFASMLQQGTNLAVEAVIRHGYVVEKLVMFALVIDCKRKVARALKMSLDLKLRKSLLEETTEAKAVEVLFPLFLSQLKNY